MGATGQKTIVRTSTKISNNNSRGKVFVLWNQQVQTDRTIPSNKPGIIIRDNEKGTCVFVVQFLIPSDQRRSMVEIRTGGNWV